MLSVDTSNPSGVEGRSISQTDSMDPAIKKVMDAERAARFGGAKKTAAVAAPAAAPAAAASETDESGAHKELSSVIFYARTTGDQEIKISIEKAEDKVTKAIFTQVKVKYGAFGNMPESEKIVSRITSNLR